MILESLLRITRARFKESGKLPAHVTIRRHGFERKYHITTIVAIASRIAGKKRTIGVSDEQNAACMIRIASREMYKYRKQSPVACWALRDVEKPCCLRRHVLSTCVKTIATSKVWCLTA